MSKFNWSNFDVTFLNAVLQSAATSQKKRPPFKSNEPEALTPYMDDLAKMPDEYFIRTYRSEIENSLLACNHKALENVYSRIVAGNTEIKHIDVSQMLERLAQKPFSQSLVNAYANVMLQIGTGDLEDEFVSEFCRPLSIDLSKTNKETIDLFSFQEEAVAALEKSLLTEDLDAGLLVMPTGSGKTRTAVYFLLSRMIQDGWQVVWLTHRHMLIDQPAYNFQKLASLAKDRNLSLNELNIMCVSGIHSSIRAAQKKDNIIIASVQSVVRSLDFLKKVLNPKVIVVVDEAHHTTATSYRRIIETIKKRKNGKTKLLGLTATPVRSNNKGTSQLMESFDNSIIYSVPTAKLIKDGVLAKPLFETINTEFEIKTTIDEQKYIKKYGEIDPALVNRIAESGKRNKVIIDQYFKNRERYGKTLIFALNKAHCITLNEELKALGVKCDYIFSGKENNDRVINAFKSNDNENSLDILININILTEGSDLPGIQTVFLTRPTQSDVLLMQMIGRGLRGIAAKGTETLNIVDFNDQWDNFAKWLNPAFFFGEPQILPDLPPDDTDGGGAATATELIPYELISAIYNSISYDYLGQPSIGRILPAGWYSLLDSEGNDITLLVMEDQLSGFKDIAEDKKRLVSDKSVTGEMLMSYFKGFDTPPASEDLQLFLDNLREDEILLHMYPFSGHRVVEPHYVADRIKAENMSLNDIDAFIGGIYDENPIAQNIFSDKETYIQRVWDCVRYPDGRPFGQKVVEMPIERIPFDITPVYDIEQLLQEVRDEMFGGVYDGISRIEWTDKPMQSWFGIYYYDTGLIRINSLLNSKDVPVEVVKYLIYHEMLHRDYGPHDKVFRAMEHKYPDYEEWDMFLDGKLCRDFDTHIAFGR